MIFHGKTSAKGWEKYQKKKFQAILERQLENNIEDLRLVMKINICVGAMIFKCHELRRAVFFALKK